MRRPRRARPPWIDRAYREIGGAGGPDCSAGAGGGAAAVAGGADSCGLAAGSELPLVAGSADLGAATSAGLGAAGSTGFAAAAGGAGVTAGTGSGRNAGASLPLGSTLALSGLASVGFSGGLLLSGLDSSRPDSTFALSLFGSALGSPFLSPDDGAAASSVSGLPRLLSRLALRPSGDGSVLASGLAPSFAPSSLGRAARF